MKYSSGWEFCLAPQFAFCTGLLLIGTWARVSLQVQSRATPSDMLLESVTVLPQAESNRNIRVIVQTIKKTELVSQTCIFMIKIFTQETPNLYCKDSRNLKNQRT